jgi:hypothetical protein
MRIRITVGEVALEADLNDTATAAKIGEALPIRTSFNTWGDEIYFSIPVDAELDDSSQEVVEIGDLGYWPPGNAFCVFFGLTPVSEPGRIMPASAVNIVGKVTGDATLLKQAMSAREVMLEAL